jgi:hypothetical protein
LVARVRLAGAALAVVFLAAAGLALGERAGLAALFVAAALAGLAFSERVVLLAVAFFAGLALGDRVACALATFFAGFAARALAFFTAAFFVAAILWLLNMRDVFKMDVRVAVPNVPTEATHPAAASSRAGSVSRVICCNSPNSRN